jgi:NADH-quinone oxidoreductase subunit N
VIQDIDLVAVAPPALLALAALAVLLLDVFGRQRLAGAGALAGVGVALVVQAVLAAGPPRRTFCLPGAGPPSCSYVVDGFAVLFGVIVLVAAAVVLLIARAEVARTGMPTAEFGFLLLCATAGALALPAARDLITLVVCLEVVALPVFALAALRRDARSAEAGLKMFLVSVVATAVMLFGVGLVYGATGTVALDRIAAALAVPDARTGAVVAVAIVLVIVGFGFKVSAVPFHFWAPDTYSGAPLAVAAFLAVVSKAAGIAGLVLVLTVGFGPRAAVWGPLVALLAAATMTVGNLVALRQDRAVRLLAWSSVAQAGYMLAPLGAVAGVVGQPEVVRELITATVAYVAIYALMTVGAFAAVSVLGERGARLEGYRGLSRQHPVVAVALAFFLACLAGLPPGLAGLFAKIVVFRAVVGGGYGWLAVVLAVNAVLGLAYYLAWARRLFAPAPAPEPAGRVPWQVTVALGLAAVGTLLLSVLPQLVLGVWPTGA